MARYLLASTSPFDNTFDSTFADQVQRVRGSIGGATFQKIGTTFSIRHRSVPTDKKRIKQTAQRQRFSVVQQFWRTLDSLEQSSFNDQVGDYARVDSLGNVYEISGLNLQNVSNSNALNQNEPFITTLPLPTSPPAIAYLFTEVQLISEIITLQTSPSLLPATHSLRIFTTRPLTEGLLYPSENYVFMGNVPAGTDPSLLNFFPEYQDRFDVYPGYEGLVFYVTLHFVSVTTLQPDLTVYGVSLPFALT